MDYTILHGTDLRVSRLCFGTMTFGDQTDESGAACLVHRCLDAGINFFDTANMYNRGVAEEFLGRAIGRRRKEIVLASKVRAKMGDAPDDVGLSPVAIRKAIEATLRRLATDYLDLYYLHQPDYNTPIEDTLEAMNRLVAEGKVRYVAHSNYAAWQVCQMFWISERRHWPVPRVTQPLYNLLARGIEQEFLPCCRELGLAVVVYNPLAGGLLTGKHDPDQAPAPGTRFDGNAMYQRRYWHPQYFEAVAELRQIASGAGLTLVELSLQWLLARPQVDCVILGASRLEQLEENLAACRGGSLPKETLAACDEVWRALRGVTPLYNR